jgi:serine/threonine protein kinase
VEGDADFFDGTYFMDEDHDTYDCLFKIKSPPEKYELLKNISHHNILGLISYDVKKKYILMEKINGETLQSYAQRKRKNLVDDNRDMTPKFKNFIK